MWKKIGVLGFSLLVGLLILMGVGQVRANAAELSGDDLTGSVTKPASITESGVTDPISIDTDLLSSQDYMLEYDWGIKDQKAISSGDYVKVQLPKTAVYDNFMTKPIDVMLSGSDKPVGTMTLDPANDKQMIITFNNTLENTNTGRKGTISIHVHGTESGGSGTGGTSASLIRKNGWPLYSDLSSSGNGNPTYVVWQIVVNPDSKNLGDVTLTDQIGPHMTFYQNANNADDHLNLTAKVDGDSLPSDDVETTASGSTINIKLKNVTQKIDILYYTKIDADYFNTYKWGKFSNSVSLSSASGGGDTATDPGVADGVPAYDSVMKNYSWGASADINGWYTGSLELTKTAFGDSTKRLEGATYDLQKLSDAGNWENYQTGLVTGADGILKDTTLEVGTYRLIETAAPDGYNINKDPVEVTITNTDTTVKRVEQQDTLKAVSSSSSTSSSTSSSSDSSSDSSSTSSSSSSSASDSSSDSSSTSSSDSSSDSSHSSASSSSSHSNHNSGSSSDSTSSSSTSSSSSISSSFSSTSTPSSKPDKVSSTSSSSSSMTSGNIANGGVTSTSSSHGSKSGSSAAKPGLQRYLPKTNEQKSLAAMIIGLAIFGISLSLWEWNRAWLRSLKH